MKKVRVQYVSKIFESFMVSEWECTDEWVILRSPTTQTVINKDQIIWISEDMLDD